MPAKRIDVNEHPALNGAGAGKHERLLFNSDNYHVWIHHSVPGDKGPMHRHTADQAFYGLQGECFINFPDGTRENGLPRACWSLSPRASITNRKRQATPAMFFMGSRAETYANSRFGPEDQEIKAGGTAPKD